MSEATFLVLIDQHQAIIHKICRLYRDTPEDREDLFQEILFQLWQSFPSFKGKSAFTSWMYRVALNTALASFRKKKTPIVYKETIPDIMDRHPEENSNREEELLLQAIRQLNDADKAIVTLYLDDLGYAAIAAILGISENNVGVKINRIKTKIHQLLKDKL